MGKGDLWDDSALINAFDDAISKYKKMHGKGGKKESEVHDGSEDVSNSGLDEHTSAANTIDDDDTNQEDISYSESIEDVHKNVSSALLEVEGEEILGKPEQKEVVDQQVPTEQATGLNEFQDLPQYDNPQDVDEYNQLYQQYYEVEELRQKILQKLHKFSSWSYPYAGDTSASSLQWGTDSANQEYQSYSNVHCGTTGVPCCSCACQCSMVSCSSLPCLPTGECTGTLCANSSVTTDLKKRTSVHDVDFVQAAMGAAEKAISLLKDRTSDGKEDNKIFDGVDSSLSSETDLSVVLNAWYSAGFHTGKYLTEQSFAKKQHS